MTGALVAAAVALGLLAAALAARLWSPTIPRPPRRRRAQAAPNGGQRTRVLFPFTATSLSPRALDAALRLAAAETATLVPVFLAHAPLRLPLEAPLPRQAEQAMRLQETIEQRAAEFGIAVDARIERGRTLRHALRQTITHEQFDRLVVAAGRSGAAGLDAETVAWLLENAPGEIVVLRPAAEPPAASAHGPLRVQEAPLLSPR